MSLASLLHSSSTLHHTHHRSSQIDPKTNNHNNNNTTLPYITNFSSTSSNSSSSSSSTQNKGTFSSTSNRRRNKPRYAQDTFTSTIRRKNIENNRSKPSTPESSSSSWDGNHKGSKKSLWSPVSPKPRRAEVDLHPSEPKKQINSSIWDEECLNSVMTGRLHLSNSSTYHDSKPPLSPSSTDKTSKVFRQEEPEPWTQPCSFDESTKFRPHLLFQNDSNHSCIGGKFKRNDLQCRSFVSKDYHKKPSGFQRTYSYRELPRPAYTANIKSSLAYQILPSSSTGLRTGPPPLMSDPEGHLIFSPGDVLCSRYRIINSLGEGTFGRVVKVRDLKHYSFGRSGTYALKIVKNIEKYRLAARLEINVLKALSKDAGHSRIVKYFDSFDYYGHKCLLFEVLGESIFEFLKSNNYSPYPIDQVQHISFQLISAISFLHELKITHTDLKPENILFVSSEYYYVRGSRDGDLPLIKRMRDTRIKLIDFGSATFEWEHHSSIVSTRHYRAPEVILELGWSTPCDVWSIGCIIFELWRGHTLFQTHSNREHLAMMETSLSRHFPPSLSLRRSPSKYFDPSTGALIWDPRSPEAAYIKKHVFVLSQHVKNPFLTPRSEIQIIDLIVKSLELDPELRARAESLGRHPFFDALESRDLSDDFYELRI